MSKICELDSWSVLSTAENGEAVLSSYNDGRLVVCKINVFTGTSARAVYNAFAARLAQEESFSVVDEEYVQSGMDFWQIYQLCTDNSAADLIFAVMERDDQVNSLLLSFEDFNDYFWFRKQFSEFTHAIDFSALHKESGTLRADGLELSVNSISDATLKKGYSADALIFMGNNKYFVVTISDHSQYKQFLNALGKYSVEFIHADGGVCTERFRLKNEDDEVSGVVELQSKHVNNHYVEVFGYWAGDTISRIENDIQLNLCDRRCAHA